MDYFQLRQGLIWLLPIYYAFDMIRMRLLHKKQHLLETKEQFMLMVVASAIMILGSSMLRVFWKEDAGQSAENIKVGATVLLITGPLIYGLMKGKSGDRNNMIPTFALNILILFGGSALEVYLVDPSFQGYSPYIALMMFAQIFSLMIGGFILASRKLRTIQFFYYVVYPIYIYFIDVKMYDFALKYQGGAFFNP